MKAKTELQKAKDLQVKALKSNDPKTTDNAHKQIVVAKDAEAAAHCAQGKAEASAHAAAKQTKLVHHAEKIKKHQAHVAVIAHEQDKKTAAVTVHDQHEASKAKVTHHQADKIHRDKAECKVSCPVPKATGSKDLPVCRPAKPEAHEEEKESHSDKKHAPHSASIAELEESYRRRNGLGEYRRRNGLGEENYRRRNGLASSY